MDQLAVVVLANRQFEVARLAAQGLSNKEIAGALGVSLHTVRNTLRVVFERLQVENRVGVANAFARGRVTLGVKPCGVPTSAVAPGVEQGAGDPETTA